MTDSVYIKNESDIKKHDAYWDAVKGIAIIAVILIHTTSNLNHNTIGVIFRQLIYFPVFFFIALAGFFWSVPNLTKRELASSLKKKANRLLPPFLLASVLYAMTRMLLQRSFHVSAFFQELPGFSLGFGYFVVALFFLFCFFPFLYRSLSAGTCFVVCMLSNLVMIAWMYWIVWNDPSRTGVAVPIPAIFFVTWLFPFCLGNLLRNQRTMTWLEERRAWFILFCIVAFGAACLEACCWHPKYHILGDAQIKISSEIQSAVLFLTAFAFHSKVNEKSCLVFLGRNSYFIYLFHWFFIIGWRKVFSYFVLPEPWYSAVIAIAVIVSCGAAAYLLNKAHWRFVPLLLGTA